MIPEQACVIGLDMGTSGARAVAIDFGGRVLAETHASLPSEATRVDGPFVEQDPHSWTVAVRQTLAALTRLLPPTAHVAGLSVDATSGTFLLADQHDQPLTPGVMYSDQRAADITANVADCLQADLAPYGIRIASSFALPKIIHLARTIPETFARCRRVIHQTDWIVGFLCGRYDVTDISTALKTGADPGRLTWPDAIEQLGVPRAILPRIVLPGTPVGAVTLEAAAVTGLPRGTPVVAGCTDGTAGCLASGACQNGDLNVTLGTTLVFKAISAQPIVDPAGAMYNHRHPAGGYLPGAASSTGADWVSEHFRGADLDALSRDADRRLPTRAIVYPLEKTGERFPFVHARAAGFGLLDIPDPTTRFAAGMEAVAFLERMALDRFQELGLSPGPTVYATGGGAANDVWLRIRATVNRRTYTVPRHAGCAVGAAVLAAMPVMGSCQEAVTRLVRGGRHIEPHAAWSDAYDELYQRFRAALVARGYVSR
ncbi:MAG: carbohydrate kinase [Planctomycetes bacterium]|nr:carbohydrate kinase [Planctomycetota bacterium]